MFSAGTLEFQTESSISISIFNFNKGRRRLESARGLWPKPARTNNKRPQELGFLRNICLRSDHKATACVRASCAHGTPRSRAHNSKSGAIIRRYMLDLHCLKIFVVNFTSLLKRQDATVTDTDTVQLDRGIASDGMPYGRPNEAHERCLITWLVLGDM